MSIYAWIILIYLHFYFWINTLNTVFFILFLSVTPQNICLEANRYELNAIKKKHSDFMASLKDII